MVQFIRIKNKNENKMYQIILDDLQEAKDNGWTFVRESLSEVVRRIKKTDDKSVFNILEQLIDEKGKEFSKQINKIPYPASKIELLTYSQQLYNQYISKYKLGYYRKIQYVVGDDDGEYENYNSTKRIFFY